MELREQISIKLGKQEHKEILLKVVQRLVRHLIQFMFNSDVNWEDFKKKITKKYPNLLNNNHISRSVLMDTLTLI